MINPRLNRRVLVGSAASFAVGSALVHHFTASVPPPVGRYFISPRKSEDETRFTVGIWDFTTGKLSEIPVPVQGHSIALHPMRAGIGYMLPQRPGKKIIEFSYGKEPQKLREVDVEEGSSFYGHGCFSADGKLFYVTQRNLANGAGMIGIRDGATLEPIGILPTSGVHPHEIARLHNGQLVVANAGDATYEDIVNPEDRVPELLPSVVVVDPDTQVIVERQTFPDPLLSARHLHVGLDDSVAIAMQYEMPNPTKAVPLGFLRHPDTRLDAMTMDLEDCYDMFHHTLSVAHLPEKNLMALTSPRGNHLTFWNTATGERLKSITLLEPSGIALDPGRKTFVISSFSGPLWLADVDTLRVQAVTSEEPAEMGWCSHATFG